MRRQNGKAEDWEQALWEQALFDLADWLGLSRKNYCLALEEEGPFVWDRVGGMRDVPESVLKKLQREAP